MKEKVTQRKPHVRLAAAVAIVAALAAPGALFATLDPRVEYRECPKCDKRIKIDLAANKAYVNLCRLEGADREAVAAPLRRARFQREDRERLDAHETQGRNPLRAPLQRLGLDAVHGPHEDRPGKAGHKGNVKLWK